MPYQAHPLFKTRPITQFFPDQRRRENGLEPVSYTHLKCRDNLNDGLRPLIVTGKKGLAVAEGLAGNSGLGERIDVFEMEQLVAANLYELGAFTAEGRRVAINSLVERYNQIVEDVETDPSLKIELRR